MDVITHKCPNCGGPLTFNPKDQKFHCDFCLSIFTAEEVSEFEEKQKQARMVDEQPEDAETITFTADKSAADITAPTETVNEASDEIVDETELDLFRCPSCGAEIATDATTAATYCYFCHNPVVLAGRISGRFLPNKVLPFAIEKETATEEFLRWAKQKRFVPRDFFNKDQIEKLTGVYFPYWVVDADVAGSYSGKGTALRVWLVGDIEYTETKVYDVYRKGKVSYKDLVKNALSKNVQQAMVNSVQPFPLEKAVDFKNQYLAGFQAEKRDIEYDALTGDVGKELKNYTQDLLRDTVSGYTTFTGFQSNVSLAREDKNYMLLPVWLVTYKADTPDKKAYYFAMNGQTGKVSGVLPISYKKLGLTAFAIAAIVAIIGMIVGYLI